MKYSKIKKSKINVKIDIKVVFVLTISFIAMQVFFNVQEGALGVSLAQSQEIISLIEVEKQKLQDELVKSSSLLNLSEKAEELGYFKPSDTIFLKKEDQFASITTLLSD